MQVKDFFKNLVTLYITIWLLVIKKLKVAYKLDGKKINFGVFLKLVDYFRTKEENLGMTRSVSFPMMQRSDSVRDLNGRRRFLSEQSGGRKNLEKKYSQDFTLRKKSNQNPTSADTRIGRLKFTCKRSLILDKQVKQLRLNNSTESSEPSSPEELSSLQRQRLLFERGRAFTSPNITDHLLRSRTTSERAEEKDQVMPLPHIIPRRGWKSCNALANHSDGVGGVHSKKTILLPRGSIPCNNGSNNLTQLSTQFKPKFKISSGSTSTDLDMKKDSKLWKKVLKNPTQSQSDASVSLKKKHSSLIKNSVPTSSVIKVAHRGP